MLRKEDSLKNKLIIIIVIIVALCGFKIDKINEYSWIIEDNKQWRYITEDNNGLLFRVSTDINASIEYRFVDKNNGGSLWKDNNEISKTHPSLSPHNAVIWNDLIFYDLNTKKFCCYDYTTGKLKWDFQNRDLLTYYNNIVCGSKLFYYKSAYSENISIYQLNITKGGIEKEITFPMPATDKKEPRYACDAILYIDDSVIYFILDGNIQCYNFKSNSYMWSLKDECFPTLFERSFIYSNNLIVYSTTKTLLESPDFWDFKICILDALTGKQLLEFDGSYQFYIDNNVLYYYRYDYSDTKSSNKQMIKAFDLYNLKEIYNYSNNDMFFRYNGFFEYDTGLVNFVDYATYGKNDVAFVFNKYLKQVSTISFPFDVGKYQISKDCIIGTREWSKDTLKSGYTICCYRLPTNKMPNSPKKENPKPVLSLIQQIIRYILSRLKGLP